jgi:nicotinate phosphoribosyltransferase
VVQLSTNNSMYTTDEIRNYQVDPSRKLFSANHEEIEKGLTTDIYFVRALEILKHMKLEDTEVTVEIFARQPGVFAGSQETLNLLRDKKIRLWSLNEGEFFQGHLLL